MKVDFKDLSSVAKTPVFSYCRKLIKQGIDPEEVLEVFRGEMLCLTLKVGTGAELLVEEDPTPHFRRYRPPTPRIAKNSWR